METQIDYIRAQLKRRNEEKQLPVVASAVGMSLRGVQYILQGKGARLATMDKLYTYLKTNSRKVRLGDIEGG